MDLFEISAECEQLPYLQNLFRKRVSISNTKQNFKIFGFDKYFLKRSKSLFKDFALPQRKFVQFDNQQINQSCECLCCGGKFKKKLLMGQKELKEQQDSKRHLNNLFNHNQQGPQTEIQVYQDPQLNTKHAKHTTQKSVRESITPVIQLIQAQCLMKKISRTHKIEQDLKQKMSEQTESLFSKVQQKLMGNDFQKDTTQKCVEKDQERKLISKKQSPCCVQYRIKTEVSNYFFINPQKKPVFNLPNLNLENVRKNCISIFESKTPRLMVRSEKYIQKQPLTQRLMCTYLKKTNTSLNNKKI